VRTYIALLLAAGLAVFALAACSNDDIGHSVLEVVSINEGAPVIDAQLDPGADKIAGTEDDFVPNGHVKVAVQNRAYDEYTTTTSATDPLASFVIDRVSVEWQPLVSGTAADNLPAFNRTYDFGQVVPRGEIVEFDVMLVTFEMKTQPFLQGLITGDPPFVAQARVTFTGHDSGATNTFYSFTTTIPVEFIGVIVHE